MNENDVQSGTQRASYLPLSLRRGKLSCRSSCLWLAFGAASCELMPCLPVHVSIGHTQTHWDGAASEIGHRVPLFLPPFFRQQGCQLLFDLPITIGYRTQATSCVVENGFRAMP